jgi:methionyl-tRNA formyltransferase
MKIAFAGTPDFAAVALEALIHAGFEVPLVLTQPDRPRGRGQKCQPSPVKALAQQHGLAVHQPPNLKTEEACAPLRDCAPDVLVVAAYGLLLPQTVLDIPRHDCINIHASLLPRWRGAAPIHRAIEAGDAQTGVCLMKMEAGLDTGPILAQVSEDIAPSDTTQTLHDRLARLGARLLVATLPDWVAGRITPHPQPEEGVLYAAKLQKAEAFLEWGACAQTLERQIRAFNPFPVAQTRIKGERVRVWQASLSPSLSGAPGEILALSPEGITVACGSGALCLMHTQRPNARPEPALVTARALGLEVGDVFEPRDAQGTVA